MRIVRAQVQERRRRRRHLDRSARSHSPPMSVRIIATSALAMISAWTVIHSWPLCGVSKRAGKPLRYRHQHRVQSMARQTHRCVCACARARLQLSRGDGFQCISRTSCLRWLSGALPPATPPLLVRLQCPPTATEKHEGAKAYSSCSLA